MFCKLFCKLLPNYLFTKILLSNKYTFAFLLKLIITRINVYFLQFYNIFPINHTNLIPRIRPIKVILTTVICPRNLLKIEKLVDLVPILHR